MNEMGIWFFKSVFKILSILALLYYLVVGVEIIHRHDSSDWQFFIKERPSLQFKFYNGMQCGKCDFVNYDDLDKKQQEQVENLCYFRYGFKKSQIYECQAFLKTR